MAYFFVSYTGLDAEWAEWIAWALEEEGHSVKLQKWDFRPGANFVIEMQKAAAAADRTIAVLSPDYLKSSFATPEWAAALAQDPTGAKFKLVPVRVRKCNLDGLWKALIYIDLVDMDEATSKKRLIEGLNPGRAKPSQPPRFPGGMLAVPHAGAPFPGRTEAPGAESLSPYVPKIRRAPTDLDQRRFVQQGFAQIKEYFEHALTEARKNNPDLDVDLTVISASEFNAEIFVNGNSKCRCRIWLGGMFGGNEISYAEGSSMRGNAVNDSLSVTVEGGNLAFRAIMGASFGHHFERMDLDNLSSVRAAEYLWRRFVTPLEY
jgi:hypothetical protein